MCDVEGCKIEPCGKKTTTFDGDVITGELCSAHFKKFFTREDHSHTHTWVNYMSLAGCACMIGLCSMGTNLV